MEVDFAEVDAPEGKKVARSLLGKAKQILIRWLIISLLCMCHDNLISMKLKRVTLSLLCLLNMLFVRARGEHAKGGELHLCPGC